MKIVGFMGSPRKNGNTAILLNKVMEGAEKEGTQTTVYYPNDLNLRGCQGCNACKKKGHCVIPDDMQNIYKAIDEADVLIFASPVYMWGMTAQLKLVVDRLYAYMNADYSSRITKPIKFALIFTQHREDQEAFMPYFKSVAGILKVIGFEFIPEILVGSGLHDAGEVKSNNTLLGKAYAYGVRLLTY
ncbi:iron-sulfur flavoprotein [Desulfocucumis palustris]|uniref:Iron-sulfur flavoprotein n=1 Tax=Desulfocucumis palustris TaxID=1898651 RepID=A0A2L2XMV4_9FIRM|nr:flavodoxin family protein [Desulfocucumis palustris]GBF35281.1 iron-sulfur flavoprotein [Desulfocucumis palustris]